MSEGHCPTQGWLCPYLLPIQAAVVAGVNLRASVPPTGYAGAGCGPHTDARHWHPSITQARSHRRDPRALAYMPHTPAQRRAAAGCSARWCAAAGCRYQGTARQGLKASTRQQTSRSAAFPTSSRTLSIVAPGQLYLTTTDGSQSQGVLRVRSEWARARGGDRRQTQ